MSSDQKPSRQDEKERLLRSGATVTQDKHGTWRVDNYLAMSRAFGNLPYAHHIKCDPEIEHATAVRDDQAIYVVLATDGVWDVLNLETVADCVFKATTAALAANEIVECAVDHGSTDNITAMVIDIRRRLFCPN